LPRPRRKFLATGSLSPGPYPWGVQICAATEVHQRDTGSLDRNDLPFSCGPRANAIETNRLGPLRAAPRSCNGLWGGLTILQELLDRHPDISHDATQEGRSDVAACVERDCSGAPVGMAKLLVRSTLTDFREPEPQQNCDLAWLQYRNGTQAQAT
jgi:hypothetical protein